MDDPTSRLPVSCTVFVVEDSMEGPEGINIWRYVSLLYMVQVSLYTCPNRPNGTENGKG